MMMFGEYLHTSIFISQSDRTCTLILFFFPSVCTKKLHNYKNPVFTDQKFIFKNVQKTSKK